MVQVFNNIKLQLLYDACYSSIVQDACNAITIKDNLLPYIINVINNKDAYEEAKTWNEFNSVRLHHEQGDKIFDRMDYNTSMCFALWSYIYH